MEALHPYVGRDVPAHSGHGHQGMLGQHVVQVVTAAMAKNAVQSRLSADESWKQDDNKKQPEVLKIMKEKLR